ncbi:hypothetical protein US8_01445 [Bacillus altitudinis]|nr:hypothetical protein US8_01445 [Bacillus altitudinis]
MNSFPGNNPLSNLVMKSDQTFLSMLKHFSRTSRLMKRFDLKGYKKRHQHELADVSIQMSYETCS